MRKAEPLAKAYDLCTLPPSIDPDVGFVPAGRARGHVVFEGVEFKYPERDVLVLFWAPWCKHSRHFYPTYSLVGRMFTSAEVPSLRVARFNVEANDLAASMPDKLKELYAKLEKYESTHFDPDRGSADPNACKFAEEKYGGFWGPFAPQTI